MTQPDHWTAASAAGWDGTDEAAAPPNSAYQPGPGSGVATSPPKFVPPPWHGAPPQRPGPAPAPLPALPAPVHYGSPAPAPPSQAPKRKGRGRRGGRQANEPRPAAPYGQDGTLVAAENFDARLELTAGAARVPGRDFVIEDGTVEPADRKKSRKKRRSRLAGGRWRRVALQTAMVVALFVLILNGLYRLAGKAIYDPPAPPPGAGFPAAAASGYASRFAYTYLTWDEEHPQVRAQELRLFFPTAVDTQFGWDGEGVQRVIGQPVAAGVTARDDQHAVVHVAAYLDPGGWTCMDVAVYAIDGGRGFAITSYTAFVACPPVAAASVPVESREEDTALALALRPTLDTFFKAYGASAPELTQVITEDSGIFGLRGMVTYLDMPRIFVPALEKGADENVRTAEVRIRWRLVSGGAVTQAYRLTLRQIGGRWFVQRVEGGVEAPDVAPAQGGVPPPSARPSPPASAGPSTSPSGSAGGSPRPSG